jgi:hypothetical protein
MKARRIKPIHAHEPTEAKHLGEKTKLLQRLAKAATDLFILMAEVERLRVAVKGVEGLGHRKSARARRRPTVVPPAPDSQRVV